MQTNSYKFVFLDAQSFELIVGEHDSVIDVEQVFEKVYYKDKYKAGTKTSSHIWLQKGKILNRTNWRFKTFAQIAEPEDKIACVMTNLSDPAMQRTVFGNMERNHFDTDFDDCLICLTQLFNESLITVKLQCEHRFHVKCLANVENGNCPLCRKVFDHEIIKRMAILK